MANIGKGDANPRRYVAPNSNDNSNKANVILLLAATALTLITVIAMMACGNAFKAIAVGFTKMGIFGNLAVIAIALILGLLFGRIWALSDVNKAQTSKGDK